jgi:hypothetical protein
VDPALAVMQRLQRQADPQIAAVALEHAEVPTDNVVEDLVAAAITSVVDGRRVVLEVDPVRHHHGPRDDRFEDRVIGIIVRSVVVQERAALEVDVLGALARGDDEEGVAGEAPLRADLGPVTRALDDRCVQLLVVAQIGESEPRRALASGRGTRASEDCASFCEV